MFFLSMNSITPFFKVAAEFQTYWNILYLLLSFPLGIFYFVLLVTGISLGVGLFITLLGVPILVACMLLWRYFSVFEIQQANYMLGATIIRRSRKKQLSFLKRLRFYIEDSFTWKGLLYLFIKLPLGIIAFVLIVTLISFSLGLVATPFIFYLSSMGIVQGIVCSGVDVVCLFVNSYVGSIVVGLFGVVLLFASLHVINGVARFTRSLTRYLLGDTK